jgi:hypothetical protein
LESFGRAKLCSKELSLITSYVIKLVECLSVLPRVKAWKGLGKCLLRKRFLLIRWFVPILEQRRDAANAFNEIIIVVIIGRQTCRKFWWDNLWVVVSFSESRLESMKVDWWIRAVLKVSVWDIMMCDRRLNVCWRAHVDILIIGLKEDALGEMTLER